MTKPLLCVVLFAFSLMVQAQREDSLLHLLAKEQGPERIDILHQLVISEWLNYPDIAMDYAEEALDLAEKAQDDYNVSKSLRLIAGVYYYRGDFDLSLDFNIRALDIAMEIGDSALINNGYNNIGLLSYNMGNYQTALEYLLRSKIIKDLIGETYGMATTLNNIGLVYERVGQFDLARKYFQEALVMSEADDSEDQIYSLNNIGNTYLREVRHDLALPYFKKARFIARQKGNTNWGAASLRGIGQVLMNAGNSDSAQFYFEHALNASRSIDDKKGISEAFYQLALLALKRADTEMALINLDNSQELATRLKLRQQMLDNLKLYARIYEDRRDFNQMTMFLARYSDMRDSVFREVEIRNLSLIPLKIKEEEDRLRLSLQQAEIDRKNATNRLYVVFILVAVPLIGFLVVMIRRNRRANQVLVESNAQLKKAQKLLITSEKMASLGMLASGIGHEINNPLNFIKNGSLALERQLGGSEMPTYDTLKPFFGAIEEGVSRASRVVKSLSQFSRIGVDMNEPCNVHEIIDNCLIILNNRIRHKAEIVKSYETEELIVRGNEGKLHQVFLNILANAEQAIEKDGVITIDTAYRLNTARIAIKDNGVGIAPEHLDRVSDPFFTTRPAGVGTGLGLFITYSIVEEHNGSIKVSSKPNVETEFVVSLPLYSPKA